MAVDQVLDGDTKLDNQASELDGQVVQDVIGDVDGVAVQDIRDGDCKITSIHAAPRPKR